MLSVALYWLSRHDNEIVVYEIDSCKFEFRIIEA